MKIMCSHCGCENDINESDKLSFFKELNCSVCNESYSVFDVVNIKKKTLMVVLFMIFMLDIVIGFHPTIVAILIYRPVLLIGGYIILGRTIYRKVLVRIYNLYMKARFFRNRINSAITINVIIGMMSIVVVMYSFYIVYSWTAFTR